MPPGGIPRARVTCALAALLATLPAPARAEERLPEIVVTAPPVRDETPAPRDPTAFASVVETREAAASIETLAEALSETVGVQVRRFGGLGDFSTVSVRGFSPGQVQIYLDGVPLSRADNEVVNLSDLPLDAIDRVEVYRGMTPLAFAQSGPGGVVNIVTRRPGPTPLLAASAGYGSFGTRKATLAAGGSRGALDALVFAQYLGSEGGFPYTNERETPQTSDDVRQFRVNDDFDQGDLTARLAYRAAPFTIAFTTDTFAKSQGVPGRETFQSPSARRETVRQIANLEVAVAPTAARPLGVDASAFVVHQEQTFTATAGPGEPFPESDVHDVTTTVGGQVVARAAVGAHHVPGLLVASNVERFEQTDAVGSLAVRPGTSPVQTRTRLSLAAEDEVLLLADRLSVVPGLRWEYVHDTFPRDPRIRVPDERATGGSQDFWTPRLGVRAAVGAGFTLLGNAARSARIPNLTELFGNNGTIKGNPALRPETALTWDAGFRFQSPWTTRVLSALGVEYAYFTSEVDDIIVLRRSSVNTFTPENVARATLEGHEVGVRATLVDRLLVTANYTRQDAIDEGADIRFLQGNRLPGRPEQEAYARIELVWSPARPLPLGAWAARLWPGRVFWDVNVIAENFLDRANTVRVGSRVLHGVGADVTLPWASLRVAWEMKNVTDDQTADALGFPLPGRSTFVTVSYGFGTGAAR